VVNLLDRLIQVQIQWDLSLEFLMIEKVLMLMLDQIVENDIQHNDEQQLSLLKINIQNQFLTKRKIFSYINEGIALEFLH
jgi:hypothetical protein